MPIPYKHGPQKREVLPSSWLSQFDLLGFDEKRGTMHLMFYFNETRSNDENWYLKFLYPQFTFCTPKFTCQGVQNPQVKNFSGHTASIFSLSITMFLKDVLLRVFKSGNGVVNHCNEFGTDSDYSSLYVVSYRLN